MVNVIMASWPSVFEMARVKRIAAKKMSRRKRSPSPARSSTTEQASKKVKPDDDKPSEKAIVPQAGPGGRDW